MKRDQLTRRKTGRPYKGVKKIGTSLSADIADELTEVSKQNGWTLSYCMEKALEMWLQIQRKRKVKITFNPYDLTDEKQAAYIRGWENAGGYILDFNTPQPWVMQSFKLPSDELTDLKKDPARLGRRAWLELRFDIFADLRAELESQQDEETNVRELDELRTEIRRIGRQIAEEFSPQTN